MNIYDIAARAGVSIATVSRVINGRGNVSEKTRNRVLAVMEQEAYTPNIFARSLGLGSMKMVGVMCSDIADIFYARAVSIIENELRAAGYDALLCCTGSDVADKKKAMELLLSKRVDAIILVGSVFKEHSDNSHIEKAAAAVPVIVINGSFDIPGTYCLLCDEAQAVAGNLRLLCSQGRRDILYLYDSESYSGITKMAGYRQGLEEAGLAERELIRRCARGVEPAREVVAGLLAEGVPFDAVVTAEDILAIGAIKALQAAGISVPGEVPVIGFNDSVLAECATPALTSVDNKVVALCTGAVRSLIDVFAGRDVAQRTVLSSQLVFRESFPEPAESL